jgi:diguanylate cyclase (GGDEF)-like protein/putative nucleotidyltransferase with HDIG domain
MTKMSWLSWFYIWGILIAGAILTGGSLISPPLPASQLLPFVVLTLLALIAQLAKVEAPNHQLYYATPVFIFAALLLLHPFYFVSVVIISFVVEWVRERHRNSPNLRNWYLQPFNISNHIIAGLTAHWVYVVLLPNSPNSPNSPEYLPLLSALAVTLAAITYVLVNHVTVGIALVLARRVSWRESGILDFENLFSDLILLLLGAVVAVVWEHNPWFVPLALSPLILMYQALKIPELKKQASTDAKTGLWNAGYFSHLFTAEMERAKRFVRPLSFVMADLDFLRNINNTYGHLAGDAVIAGIGQIIRASIREYDIAGRFGGEEFAIALPETGLAEACAIAERIRQSVESTNFDSKTNAKPIRVTMSLGIASFPDDASTPNALIHQADIAVYQAKLKGRNCIVSASEIPQSMKLEYASTFDRLADFSDTRANSESAQDTPSPGAEQPVNAQKDPNRYTKVIGNVFLSGVIVAGVVATSLGVSQTRLTDLGFLGVLAVLAMISEWFEVKLYWHGTMSVSVAVAFAAVLIAGIPGVVVTSAAITIIHYLKNRRVYLYQSAFNYSTHVIAGTVLVAIFRIIAMDLRTGNFLPLLIVSFGAALVYFVIESGFVSIVIGLSAGENILDTWNTEFRWIALYYLALSFVGLFMSIAYSEMGIPGILVFVLPMLMLYYGQRQYVERTEDGVRELQRMNKELTNANRQVTVASQSIRELNGELFITLAKIIDARDPYVLGHATKVADYAIAVSKEIHLPPERIEHIRQAALLHDIGKIGISEQVLNKPSKLTGLEYEHIKTHTTLGAEFLNTCQSLRPLVPFILHHHEWWNGKGYPDQLACEQIPLEARILAICDAIESMASDRPYQRAKSLNAIIEEIKRQSGKQFDPMIADVCVRILSREGEQLIVNSAREIVEKKNNQNPKREMPGKADELPATSSITMPRLGLGNL